MPCTSSEHHTALQHGCLRFVSGSLLDVYSSRVSCSLPNRSDAFEPQGQITPRQPPCHAPATCRADAAARRRRAGPRPLPPRPGCAPGLFPTRATSQRLAVLPTLLPSCSKKVRVNRVLLLTRRSKHARSPKMAIAFGGDAIQLNVGTNGVLARLSAVTRTDSLTRARNLRQGDVGLAGCGRQLALLVCLRSPITRCKREKNMYPNMLTRIALF